MNDSTLLVWVIIVCGRGGLAVVVVLSPCYYYYYWGLWMDTHTLSLSPYNLSIHKQEHSETQRESNIGVDNNNYSSKMVSKSLFTHSLNHKCKSMCSFKCLICLFILQLKFIYLCFYFTGSHIHSPSLTFSLESLTHSLSHTEEKDLLKKLRENVWKSEEER